MNRLAALALALSLAATSAVAAAAPAGKTDAARHEKGDKRAPDDKKFPMKADEFKTHVADHLKKSRERLEKQISRKKPAEEKAKEMRARFEAGVAKVNQKTAEVTADGTVTKEEAKSVFALFREMHGGHHGKKPADKK